jgi:acyl-CoA thioester hydrolase
MTASIEINPRYAETDQMGVIYHGNYFTYFEVARTNLFDALGYSYRKLEDEGIILPVTEVQCRYKKPIKYGEKIIVSAEVSKVQRIKITFEYKIHRESDGELLAIGCTKHGFVDKQLNPVRFRDLNPEFRAIIEQLKAGDSCD